MSIQSPYQHIFSFAKAAFDQYSYGWQTGDFSQFVNFLNQVTMRYYDHLAEEPTWHEGIAGYKHLVSHLKENGKSKDRLQFSDINIAVNLDMAFCQFKAKGKLNGKAYEGNVVLALGIKNSKVVSLQWYFS